MEAFLQQDVEGEMTAPLPQDATGQAPEGGDEVESLRNSLRDAVHDVNVRPKMQCLMMDSSFSMVTVQGEDSGIAWETTPSGHSTPWPPETLGAAAADVSFPTSPTPSTHLAGKIIFVMDEGVISRRKKSKERSKVDRRQEEVGRSSDDISGRPELVEVSRPNVKGDEKDQEEPKDPLGEKEQRLFTLVSEGSEILNIVVPPKLSTVDEEESRTMEDNLSYLEEKPLLKANLETPDQEEVLPTVCPALPGMDPPGAPVAKPPEVAGAAGHLDYFEAFSLMEAEAPGGPAAALEEQVEQEDEESQHTEKPPQAEDDGTKPNVDTSDTISLLEITSELLDEVFYGNTDSRSESVGRVGAAESAPVRVPLKTSGYNLFGSQEDILTPIFLPEGPPKIIDPILLEEPTAMAFLYTDLYEEALGSRTKEEDAASMSSEKSFHSRQSDREARGYLEKYVLIDETPVVEAEPSETEEPPADGPRTLTQDLYEFGDFLTSPENVETIGPEEEEITDFFRSSGNSSPCDIEPFLRSGGEDDDVPATKSNTKEVKRVCIKVSETLDDAFSDSTYETFLEDEPDGDGYLGFLEDKDISVPTDEKPWKDESEASLPVPPPRRNVASSPKSRLDLTPLTPVDLVPQDEGGASGKEQREEEKETASPAETADEGDGCGDEADFSRHAEGISPAESMEKQPVRESEENTIGDVNTHDEPELRTSAERTEETPVQPVEPETPVEATKPKAQCVIL